LVWKHEATDDDRWLYLPALKSVRRLSVQDERTSFANSDFFYEDLTGRLPSEDTHKLQNTTDTYFVVISRPKDLAVAEFDEYVSWIHRQSFVPVKIEYKKSGQVQRVVTVLETKNVQGYVTVVKVEVADLKRDSKSVLVNDAVQYNRGLTDDIFTERFLAEPPAIVLEKLQKGIE